MNGYEPGSPSTEAQQTIKRAADRKVMQTK